MIWSLEKPALKDKQKAIDREELVSSFFSETGKSYDTVVRVFTLGQDSGWKQEILKHIPPSQRILELGCGTGILTEYLSRQNPQAEIVGVDITEDYLALFRERLKRKPWIRGQPILGNAETVGLRGMFDAVASSYLAKYVDPDALLDNIYPHIDKGGVFVAHDFTLPSNPLYRSVWAGYTKLMNLVGVRMFPEWHNVFNEGLSDLVKETRWYDSYHESLLNHGFDKVGSKKIGFESAGVVWGTKT